MDMETGNLMAWGFMGDADRSGGSSTGGASTPSVFMQEGEEDGKQAAAITSPTNMSTGASATTTTTGQRGGGEREGMDGNKPGVSEEVFLQAMMENKTSDIKNPLSFNEKDLREAAAQEVAEQRAREKEASDGQGDSHSRRSLPQSSGAGPRRKLTAEEKQAASRYRNREHARNTRLRKKAYMQKLKETVDNLEKQRRDDLRAKELAATR